MRTADGESSTGGGTPRRAVTAPPQPSSPAATRLALPRWRDARLLLGLLLVLGSVVLGARLLGSGSSTTPVWAAARDLPAGSLLTTDDLVSRDVRLGETSSSYVAAADVPLEGLVLLHPVAAGELLPVSAVDAGSAGPDVGLVAVALDRTRIPGALAHGDRVDVYVTVRGSGGDADTTSLVVSGVTVHEVLTDGGRLGPAGSTVGVVLAVPPAQVRDVVAAGQAGAVDLVRLPG